MRMPDFFCLIGFAPFGLMLLRSKTLNSLLHGTVEHYSRCGLACSLMPLQALGSVRAQASEEWHELMVNGRDGDRRARDRRKAYPLRAGDHSTGLAGRAVAVRCAEERAVRLLRRWVLDRARWWEAAA